MAWTEFIRGAIVFRRCDAWNVFAEDPGRVRSITHRDRADAVRERGRG
jgi:hypothetical protein